MPDILLTGSRVQRLYLEQSQGRTVTAADWAHALHADGCTICDDNAAGFTQLERQREAAEAAREILAAGILRLLQRQQAARRTRLRSPLSAEQFEHHLGILRYRAHRVWKNGGRL
jgi:hypothetical protein